MTAEWFLSIVANLTLFAFLCICKPVRMRVVWMYQAIVLSATALNLYGWYRLSEYSYNRNWFAAHLVQIWAEVMLAGWLIVRTRFFRNIEPWEVAASFALILRLHLELQSYWSWDAFAFADGLTLLRAAHWANPVFIACMCGLVYAHRSATALGESNETVR